MSPSTAGSDTRASRKGTAVTSEAVSKPAQSGEACKQPLLVKNLWAATNKANTFENVLPHAVGLRDVPDRSSTTPPESIEAPTGIRRSRRPLGNSLPTTTGQSRWILVHNHYRRSVHPSWRGARHGGGTHAGHSLFPCLLTTVLGAALSSLTLLLCFSMSASSRMDRATC